MHDSSYMERCLELARKGTGRTSPNPMVGCVITCNNKIIGEGYHKRSGESHAEVNAIHSVENKNLLSLSTLYVNLEPCSHFGKTPPCADLIVQYKIPRVIIGTPDPNPQVAGKGIARLKEAGCEVIVDVLKKECEELNKRFFFFHQNKRPFVILKWAQTEDGFIDIFHDEDNPQEPTWITDETCRTLVHKWRAEEDAILVGTRTALMDNPELTVRSWTGNNPVRLVLDRRLSLSANLHIFNNKTPTIIYNDKVSKKDGNTSYVRIDFKNSIQAVLSHLYQNEKLSVMVEGGGKILTSIIQLGLWNEARVFTGKISFQTGVRAPMLIDEPNEKIIIGNSFLNIYKNSNY